MIRDTCVTVAVLAGLLASGCSSDTAKEKPGGEAETPASGETSTMSDEKETGSGPVNVILETNKGEITVELWPDKARKTVENFLRYVDRNHYDGTIFHRVIPGFMIQGGGFTPQLEKKPTLAPIRNEAKRDVPNRTGTIAMARTSDPHSASAQFFINLKHNRNLDRGRCPDGWGYAVFGKVIDGMDVVREIAGVQTSTTKDGRMKNVPVEPVVIREARRTE